MILSVRSKTIPIKYFLAYLDLLCHYISTFDLNLKGKDKMTNPQVSKIANYSAMAIIILSLLFAMYFKENKKPIRFHKKEIENIM